MKEIEFRGIPCVIEPDLYANGGIALSLFCSHDCGICAEGEHIMRATIWIPGLDPDTELAIKDHSEGEGVLDLLVGQGIVEPPHRYAESGFVAIPVCRPTEEMADWIAEELDQ